MKAFSLISSGVRMLVMTSLAMAMSGCVESTNIQASGGGTVSSCSSLLGTECVNGRFIDEAVENLDYECGLSGVGTVKSVTDVDGGFSCPQNSIVTFALVNPDDPTQKIPLGKAKVRRPADIFGQGVPLQSFYVTPYSLAGGRNEAPSSNRTINVARLLQTLNTDSSDTRLPSHHIKIENNDKKRISNDLFAADTEILELNPVNDASNPDLLINPPSGTFDKAIKPFLELIPKTQLVSSAAASATLTKGVYSTFAGIYASLPPLLDTGGASDADYGHMAGYGTLADAGKKFLGQIWVLVDRKGRMIGSGIYSYKNADPSDLYLKNPQPMVMDGFGTADSKIWPLSGNLAGLKFSLRGDLGKTVRITAGLMDTRGAIASTAVSFKRIFNNEPPDDGTVYGKWNLEAGSTTYISDAPYALEHMVVVAPFVNPDLWEPPSLSLPIPLSFKLYNTDPACGAGGCPIADIRAVILEDGNLVSDIENKCGEGLDRDTLEYPAFPGKKEYALGVIANILRGDAAESSVKDQGGHPITVITPLLMIPDIDAVISNFALPGFENYLRYAQFGSNFGSSFYTKAGQVVYGKESLIRVDAGGGDQYQMYGVCSNNFLQAGLCTTLNYKAPGLAVWVNQYTSARAVNAVAGSSAQLELTRNAGGFIKASLRTCGP